MSGRRVAPVDEVACRLEADGRPLRVFHCTPERYVDLAIGWLVGAGLMEPGWTEPPRISMGWDDKGPILSVESVADSWSDHDIRRPADVPPSSETRVRPPADFRDVFRDLYARAPRYQETGGIHAAAIVEGTRLVAHAEDVGRHNAVDKAIGQAALARRDLGACGLVTSARVSGAMAQKAATAGLAWIASRSVPTSMALATAMRAGMTIVARAPSPEARRFDPDDRPLGVVLAGGRNRRFGGAPKALEEVGGHRIIERAIAALRPLCADVVMIANKPSTYADVDLRTRPDSRAGAGPLGGVREGIAWARERGLPGAIVVACDMPFVPTPLLDALWRASEGHGAAVPASDGPRGVEPLCAAYRVASLDAIERALDRGDLRVIGFFEDAGVHRLELERVAAYGDPDRIFFNVNTPEELERARAMHAAVSPLEEAR